MAPYLVLATGFAATGLAATGTDDAGIDGTVLDLTDEDGLLAEDYAEYNPDGMRALLAALNLKPAGVATSTEGEVFDLAVYRATGDRHLATLFGSAR